MPVIKQDGSVRVCGDYKVTVNQVSKLDNYPIPKTDDLLTVMGGSEKFTKLDLSQAYQQLLLDDESKKFTTINTHKGLYQYNRLPFGISSAPGIFQRTLENLLKGIPYTVTRLDDILIGGRDEDDHLHNVNTVLTRLNTAGLRLREDKCTFMALEVVYCGHIINKSGIQPVKEKVEAIDKAPEPQNVSQLKSFLGMLNYYHKWLPNVSTVLEPLHELLRSGRKWKWGTEQQEAFEKSKRLLKSAELLVHFDPEKEIVLASDASDYGLGAVLSHKLDDGSERPVGYVSRTLNSAERNYSTTEKEALAVVFGVKKFHQYLYGNHFTIRTDHKPLEGLFGEGKPTPQMATPRVQRWILTLASYEYKLSYKPGTDNGNADALSRLPIPEAPDVSPQPGDTVLLMEHLNGTPVTASQIRVHTLRDGVLSQVLQNILQGWPAAKLSEELKTYQAKQVELSVEDGCVLWGCRVVIPEKLRPNVLELLHEAHPGASRMKSLARSYVWWPGLDKDIEKTVKACQQCQEHQKAPAEAPLHPWEWPDQPWSRVHLDYLGPFQGNMFLVGIDAYSKWLEIHRMNSTTSASTIQKLREVFSIHGLPDTIVSDNGTNFTSDEFETFLSANGIKHIKSAPYHPATNGLAERAVGIFKQFMRKANHGTVEEKIARFLLQYRVTPHSTTGVPPAQLLMKRQIKTRLDLLKPNLAAKVRAKQTCQKSHHDYHARDREFEVDDPVYVKDFRAQKSSPWLPGKILAKTGPVSAAVKLHGSGQVIRRHQDHIRIRRVAMPEVHVSIQESEQCDQPELPSSEITEITQPSTPPLVITPRPVRQRKVPKHLLDYELE